MGELCSMIQFRHNMNYLYYLLSVKCYGQTIVVYDNMKNGILNLVLNSFFQYFTVTKYKFWWYNIFTLIVFEIKALSQKTRTDPNILASQRFVLISYFIGIRGS